MTDDEVAAGLTGIPGWTGDSRGIEATYALATFPLAIDLVRLVAAAAEEADHHPDIDIRWRRVTFRLTTHEAGAVTTKDLDLAGRIQAAAQSLGWQPS